jgi:prepilin-type processing-associated H-X9-DG protein
METYSSLHAGGANFAYCDGSTQFVSETIDPVTMMELTTKSEVELPKGD